MKYFQAYIFYSISCVFCIQVLAQPVRRQDARPEFSLRVFNDANSMVQDNITDMSFDRYHYLWIGTSAGILRYDGRNFTSITTYNNPLLRFNHIFSVGMDASQQLYATDEQWNFYKVHDAGTLDVLPDVNKAGFYLHIWHCPVFFFKPIHAFASAKALQDTINLNNEGIKKLFLIDSSNAYIFFTDRQDHDQLMYLQDGQINTVHLPSGYDPAQGFILNHIFYVAGSDGRCVSLEGTHLTPHAEKWMPIARPEYAKIPGDHIATRGTRVEFFSSDDGTFFITNHTLFSVSYAAGALKADPIFKNELLDGNIIQILYSKEEHIYFLGTLARGMIVLQEKQFRSLQIGPPEGSYLVDSRYYAQAEVSDNTILTNNYTLFTPDTVIKLPHPSVNRLAMLKDKSGNLWYGRADSLLRLSADGKVEKYIGYLGQLTVNGFSEQGRDIWFTNPNMLGRVAGDTVQVIKQRSAIDSSAIQCIGDRIDSLLLIGTARGLYALTFKDSFVVKMNKAPMFVRSIHTDNLGYSWITTYGQGLYCLYNKQLTKLPVDRMGNLLQANCFLEDEKGFFWVSTSNGLFKINKSDLIRFVNNVATDIYYHYFDKTDGFLTNEFNGGCSPCGLKLADGSFSFPSLEGLVRFSPSDVKVISPTRPLYIDKIIVDSSSLPLDGPFAIKASFNQLQFQLSTPYFGNSNNLHVEYKLQGLGDKWNMLNPDGKLTYNKLPGGKYTLQVRKLAGFGRPEYDVLQQTFSVREKFTETPLFYISCLIFLLILVLVSYRIRYRWMISTNKKLEHEVQIRTKEKEKLIGELQQYIVDLNRSRESENRIHEEKQNLISILVHDLSSPLKFLNKLANRLSLHFNSLSTEDHQSIVRELSASSAEIYSFTDNFLHWVNPSMVKIKTAPEIFDIKDVLQETVAFHIDNSTARANTILLRVQDPCTMIGQKNAFRTIVRNLLHFANNNAQDALITISYEKIEQTGRLRFEYAGVTVSPDLIKRIQIAETYPTGLEINQYPAYINLTISKQLTDQLKGRLEIHSSPQGRTAITIDFANTASLC